MKNGKIEVEIKTLLGSIEAAQDLKNKMKSYDKNLTFKSKHSQLNHYFDEGNLTSLKVLAKELFDSDDYVTFERDIDSVQSFSVRTRKADDTVLFIVKATVDDTTSSNGTARREFEVPVSITLEKLDQKILDAGFSYQAKWSRDREEYEYKGLSVSIDKNAGYGYLAEFERIIHPDEDFERVKREIRDELSLLGLEELSQDRLGRMFDHYNSNWAIYYGTDKTFTIK